MVNRATRRNGEVLQVGDRVITDFPQCAGFLFVIVQITPWPSCESGYMVLVELHGEPERLLKGSTGYGLDTNWFTKHEDAPANQ